MASGAQPFSEIPELPAPGGAPVARPRPGNPYGQLLRAHAAMGPIFRVRVPGSDRHLVYVSDEGAIRRILDNDHNAFTKGQSTKEPFASIVPLHLISLDDGPVHATMRRAALAGVSNERCQKHLAPIAVKQAEKFLAKLQLAVEGSGGRAAFDDIDRRCRALALDVISEALFGAPWGAQDDASEAGNPPAWALAEVMMVLHWRIVDLSDTAWRQDRLHGGAERLLAILESHVAQQIAHHRRLSAAGSPPDDILTLLLEHRSDAGTHLEDEQVVNLVLTFLTMGHENIGTAIAWTLILLAEDRNAQNDVRAEIRAAATAGTLASIIAAQEERMPVTRKAFEEAIRLYPTVPALTRTPVGRQGAVVLGYQIPPGTEIALNIYAMHRLANVGEDADSFCPARAYRGRSFGGGSRVCLGRALAYVEVYAVLATILSKLELHAVKATKPAVVVSLRPSEPKILVAKL